MLPGTEPEQETASAFFVPKNCVFMYNMIPKNRNNR